jgi:hypothetical protein
VIGTMVLGAAFAYVAAFYFLAKHAPTRPLKIAAVVVGLAIPFWELPISVVSYGLQCHEHGGLQILGDPPRAESIVFDPDIGYRPDYLVKQYGFKRIEYVNGSRVSAYTVTNKGLERSIQSIPSSAFKISYVANQSASWNVARNDLILAHVATGKVVARHSGFVLRGMWWQDAIAFAGRATLGRCHMNDQNELLRFASQGIK